MSTHPITKLNHALLCIYQDNAAGNSPPISQFNGELLLKLVERKFVELWNLFECPEPLVSITESGKKYLKETIEWKKSIAGPDSDDTDTEVTDNKNATESTNKPCPPYAKFQHGSDESVLQRLLVAEQDFAEECVELASFETSIPFQGLLEKGYIELCLGRRCKGALRLTPQGRSMIRAILKYIQQREPKTYPALIAEPDNDTDATEAAGESFLIDPKAVVIVEKEPKLVAERSIFMARKDGLAYVVWMGKDTQDHYWLLDVSVVTNPVRDGEFLVSEITQKEFIDMANAGNLWAYGVDSNWIDRLCKGEDRELFDAAAACYEKLALGTCLGGMEPPCELSRELCHVAIVSGKL